MTSKLIIVLVLAAMASCALAQLLVSPLPGVRDVSGGYLDHYTGQYSSAITGNVYNTVPRLAPITAPIVAAPIAAPLLHGGYLGGAALHGGIIGPWIRR